MKKQGFTLIELLVVIAIIGILSSVVLASLNTARQKGKDAAAKAELSGMRAQAELDGDTDNGYTGICTTGKTSEMFTSAVENVDGDETDSDCQSDATSWAAHVTLSDGVTFCVDNSGHSGVGTVDQDDDENYFCAE
jgi:prepilin-type N-terminal cleavage/methylation domain-containing protein